MFCAAFVFTIYTIGIMWAEMVSQSCNHANLCFLEITQSLDNENFILSTEVDMKKGTIIC